MADIQKQFGEFNEAIRLKQYEQNATLREKRDAVLKKLKERMKTLFEEGYSTDLIGREAVRFSQHSPANEPVLL